MKLSYLYLSLIIISGCQPSVKPTALPPDSISTVKDTVPAVPFIAKFQDVVTIDLNNDGKIDSLTLSGPPTNGAPGIFQKIEIALNGGDRESFEPETAWDVVDESFLKENQNSVESPYIFVYKDNKQYAILLFGYVYGSGRSDFNIIYGQGAHFKMIFKGAFQVPMKLQDMNQDGKLELLGRISEFAVTGEFNIDSLGPGHVGSYDPFSVFAIEKDTIVLDEVATREYNEQNYIWLGKEPSETLRIYYFSDESKPVVVK